MKLVKRILIGCASLVLLAGLWTGFIALSMKLGSDYPLKITCVAIRYLRFHKSEAEFNKTAHNYSYEDYQKRFTVEGY